jgi:hypothetical protein
MIVAFDGMTCGSEPVFFLFALAGGGTLRQEASRQAMDDQTGASTLA